MARLPDPAGSRAVLFGTSVYQDPSLPALPGVANNLTDFAAVLTSPHGAGLPAEHCLVLRDPPLPAAIGSRIVAAARAATDVLLVYYSGHGVMSLDDNNELYLTLHETEKTQLLTSAFRYASLRQYILDSPAKIKVVILDCCMAGRTPEHTMGSPADDLLNEVDVVGTYVLAAAKDKALAPPGWRNTLFTGELVRLLKEGIPAESGTLLTLDVLYREVRKATREHNWPEPSCNNRNTAAHLALAHNAAHEVRKAMAALRSDIDKLAAEEGETDRAYATATEKILEPNLPQFNASAPILRDRLAAAEQHAHQGILPSAAELAELNTELSEALSRAQRLRELAIGPVDRRDRLRGRLKGYQAMAVRLGFAEEAEIARRYREARDLLWTKPCDLGEATKAVNASMRAVTDRRERRE